MPIVVFVAAAVVIAFVIRAHSQQGSVATPGVFGGTIGVDTSGATGDAVTGEGDSSMAVITNNPDTWPSTDGLWLFCQAIARQEGAATPGSVPDRANNPGDISDGAATYGYITGGRPGDPGGQSKVTQFPDKATGWQWLYNKFRRALDGTSSVYSGDMTIAEIGSHYAGDPGWAAGVASNLGVDVNTTLQDFVNANGGYS